MRKQKYVPSCLCSKGMYQADGQKNITETFTNQQNMPMPMPNYSYNNRTNKSPSYYLDLSQSIGGRPVYGSHDSETTLNQMGPVISNYNGSNLYNCSQPMWNDKCT